MSNDTQPDHALRTVREMASIGRENAIVDAIHDAAARLGYDPDILPGVAAHIAGPDADEDARGRVLAEVQAVWRRRFDLLGC